MTTSIHKTADCLSQTLCFIGRSKLTLRLEIHGKHLVQYPLIVKRVFSVLRNTVTKGILADSWLRRTILLYDDLGNNESEDAEFLQTRGSGGINVDATVLCHQRMNSSYRRVQPEIV